jgi:hypothetical protein
MYKSILHFKAKKKLLGDFSQPRAKFNREASHLGDVG